MALSSYQRAMRWYKKHPKGLRLRKGSEWLQVYGRDPKPQGESMNTQTPILPLVKIAGEFQAKAKELMAHAGTRESNTRKRAQETEQQLNQAEYYEHLALAAFLIVNTPDEDLPALGLKTIKTKTALEFLWLTETYPTLKIYVEAIQDLQRNLLATGIAPAALKVFFTYPAVLSDPQGYYHFPEETFPVFVEALKWMKATRNTDWRIESAVQALKAARALHIDAEEWEKAREFVHSVKGLNPDAQIKRMEMEIMNSRQIPGFFPTPRELADRMAFACELFTGARVLEPSAGKGDLVQAVLREWSGAKVECIEYNDTLQAYLQARGWTVIGKDFMEKRPEDLPHKYDAVIMNPPFENRADIRHIRYAWDFLKKGGRLVALCSEGFTYRTEEEFVLFRTWLERIDADVSDRLDEAFKQAERKTSVGMRLIIAKKE